MNQISWKNMAYCFALHGLLSLITYTPQGHMPMGGITHRGLVSVTLTFNQENTFTDKSDGGNFFFEVLSSQVTQVCIKSTKTNHHRT